MLRLRRPYANLFFQPYAVLGLGTVHYDLNADTALVEGQTYGPNPTARTSVAAGLGADLGSGPVALRLEMLDIIGLKSPLGRSAGTAFGPVQHFVVTVGLSLRFGHIAGLPSTPHVTPSAVSISTENPPAAPAPARPRPAPRRPEPRPPPAQPAPAPAQPAPAPADPQEPARPAPQPSQPAPAPAPAQPAPAQPPGTLPPQTGARPTLPGRPTPMPKPDEPGPGKPRPARPAPVTPAPTPTPPPPDTTPAPAPPDTTPVPAPPDTTPAPAPPDTTPAPAPPSSTVHGRLFTVLITWDRASQSELDQAGALDAAMSGAGVPVWPMPDSAVGSRKVARVRVGALRNDEDGKTLGTYLEDTYGFPFAVIHIEKTQVVPAVQVQASEAFVDKLDKAKAKNGKNGGKPD
ncbi:MAG: hypothetical protein P8Z36_01755 [Gemmatimonadota bacterium]